MAFDRPVPNSSIVAASPRASATVDMIITITAANKTNNVSSSTRTLSESTVMAKIHPTNGFAKVIVGNDAVRSPARKDACWNTMPASATASQAYNSGARSSAPTPSSLASTTPFVSTANSASDEPATTASNTAATAPDQIRAPSTQNTNAGPITMATTAQVSSGARCWSDVGLPTMTMTATAAASAAAQNHSRAVTR